MRLEGRNDTLGLIQIVVGMLGIFTTLWAAPGVFNAVNQIAIGGSLPNEFSGLGGGLQVFIVILVLLSMVFMFCTGVMMSLHHVLNKIEVRNSLALSTFAVLFLVFLALGLCGLVYEVKYVPFPLTLAILCLIFMFMYASIPDYKKLPEEEREEFTTAYAGAMIFFFFIALAVASGITWREHL